MVRNPHFCPLSWKNNIKDKELSPAARVLESRPSSILNQLLGVSDRFLDSSEFVFLHQQDADFQQMYVKGTLCHLKKWRIIKLSGSPHQVVRESMYEMSSLKCVKCKTGDWPTGMK